MNNKLQCPGQSNRLEIRLPDSYSGTLEAVSSWSLRLLIRRHLSMLRDARLIRARNFTDRTLGYVCEMLFTLQLTIDNSPPPYQIAGAAERETEKASPSPWKEIYPPWSPTLQNCNAPRPLIRIYTVCNTGYFEFVFVDPVKQNFYIHQYFIYC